jgi:SAM-dependent methyltransferase
MEERASDPAYEEEISPLLLELLDPQEGSLYIDLGCGNGAVLAQVVATGSLGLGCDQSQQLLREAAQVAPVVRARLPNLEWARPASFDGAYIGLVLEHLEDEGGFLRQVASAVKPRGVLALVINHPIWTAPQSSPIDTQDGEVLWRPGRYFGRGYSDEPAGARKVRFYHRTLADLMNAASLAGWDLQMVTERGISARQMERSPEYAGQEHIPRLLGARWLRRSY